MTSCIVNKSYTSKAKTYSNHYFFFLVSHLLLILLLGVLLFFYIVYFYLIDIRYKKIIINLKKMYD